MPYSTVLYPLPPPTHNALTATERTHLLRSNAKIGKLLGSTPHVLDEVRWNISTSSLSSVEKKRRRRGSVDSTTFYEQPEMSSSVSSSTLNLPQSRSSCESSSSSASSTAQRPSSRAETESTKSWRMPFVSSCRPPILRLGKHSRTGSSSSEEDGAGAESPTSPSFAIPSEAALRRQKMARLRKRLGEDVPVHLVFPPTINEDSDDDEICVVESPTTKSPGAKYCEEDRPLLTPDPRRSRNAESAADGSGVGSGPRVVNVHYADQGTRGWESETFKGLRITCRRITTIPEE